MGTDVAESPGRRRRPWKARVLGLLGFLLVMGTFGALAFAFSEPRDLELKGLQGTYPVHAVEWDLAHAGA